MIILLDQSMPLDQIICGACGESITLDDCDSIGACEGNLSCNLCNEEINGDGKAAEPCGKCDACKSL